MSPNRWRQGAGVLRLQRRAEGEILRRLRQPVELPPMAVVATFKVLAKMHGRRGMMEHQECVSIFLY